VGGLLASPFIYLVVLQEYMRQRLTAFISPTSDPLGAGYNILQAEISVGSGGLFGKGFLCGTQSQLHFLRIQKTDFIFSVLGEELGFVGALFLLGLFVLLLFRGIRAAMLARDEFGRLIATGVVVMILVQVFINIGANLRLLPVTGVTLPLISYGGSSLITVLIALGTLQSILIRQRKIEF
jgi:rod shape determining protein RodA